MPCFSKLFSTRSSGRVLRNSERNFVEEVFRIFPAPAACVSKFKVISVIYVKMRIEWCACGLWELLIKKF